MAYQHVTYLCFPWLESVDVFKSSISSENTNLKRFVFKLTQAPFLFTFYFSYFCMDPKVLSKSFESFFYCWQLNH